MPDLGGNAESTPKQPVKLPSSDKFRSLRGPQKLSLPKENKQGRPMANPALMAAARGPRDIMSFKAHKRGKPASRVHITGSTSPQPKLSVPSRDNGILAQPEPLAAPAQESKHTPLPVVTRQSTPVKTRQSTAAPRPFAAERSEAFAGPANVHRFTGPVTLMPCKTGDGSPTHIKYSEADNWFVLGGRSFVWSKCDFVFERRSHGDVWRFTLTYDHKKLKFSLNYANCMLFKAACGKHKAAATQIGDRQPPESLKRLEEDSGAAADGKTIDVTILGGTHIQRTTLTLNSRGLYMNNNMYKKFEWPFVTIARTAPPPAALHVKYDVHYKQCNLTLELGRKEALILDKAVEQNGVSTCERQNTPNTSITTLDDSVDAAPRSETIPRAESSPKNEMSTKESLRSGHASYETKSSLESGTALPASLSAVVEDKRAKLQQLRRPLPKPSLRASRPRMAGDDSLLSLPSSDNHAEISPQAFYGSPSRSPALSSPEPKNRSVGVSREPQTEPINLTSPEKPISGRRTRQRTRHTVEELEDIGEPVEPTEEDFELLRRDGFHRVAHRFWDGRLMEVSVEDIARLNPRIYVNDNIIWFFLRWYLERLHAHDARMFDQILLLNTFFYPEVRKGDSPKWITKLPLLSKHITVMPIHEASHWSVAIIIGLDQAFLEEEPVKPAIVVLDSLGPAQNHHTFRKVVSVLRTVLKMHNKPLLTTREYRSLRTPVPVQTNHTDCGVFLLHYIEQIFERPGDFVTAVNDVEGRTLDMGDFWRESELQTKRDDLKRRLKRLGSEENSTEAVTGHSDDDNDDLQIVGMEQVMRKRRKIEKGQRDVVQIEAEPAADEKQARQSPPATEGAAPLDRELTVSTSGGNEDVRDGSNRANSVAEFEDLTDNGDGVEDLDDYGLATTSKPAAPAGLVLPPSVTKRVRSASSSPVRALSREPSTDSRNGGALSPVSQGQRSSSEDLSPRSSPPL